MPLSSPARTPTTLEILVSRHAGALRYLGFLSGVLVAEILALTTWLDGAALVGRSGLAGEIGGLGAWVLRFLVGFAFAFAAFAGVRGKFRLDTLLDDALWRWPWFAAHLAAGTAFGGLSAALYGNWQVSSDLVAVSWIVTGVATFSFLGLAFYPLFVWTAIFRASENAWMFAAGVSALGCLAVQLSQSLWQSVARFTFSLVKFLLRPVVPHLTVDGTILRLRGHHFGVIISRECSGLEGMGLIVVFTVAWLWLYRVELRFPRAYLLLPLGVVTLYALNAVRIAALFLLGEAGASQIAEGGFHSQAGWIAFNAVALAMTWIVPRSNWFRVRAPAPDAIEARAENPTAVHLMPFLAILAAGMLARSASADFEWLYGLRFLAAALTLWMFREPLRRLDWSFSYPGILTGCAVFAVWLAADWWLAIPAAAMPAALSLAGPSLRFAWIAVRVLAATVTVPVAEELAFRGFLMRRLASRDFELLAYRVVPWFAVIASSLCFGLLHGPRWISGSLAGLAFALAARRMNRLGESVAAHTVTNALLAFWVLYSGQWQFW